MKLETGSGTVAASLAAIALVSAFLVHVLVLERFPNSGDEHAYLWQATAFAQGTVTAESPQPQDAFRVSHIGDVSGRRFSKYPPGWPLLLSGGVIAGAPGMVNPLLSALALAGIYWLACGWIGRRWAMLGACVVLATPFFLLNAGSYHSHPSSLFAVTALALALTWAEERRSPVAIVLAGASFGLAVLIRPFTALLVAVPLLVAFAPSLLRGGRMFLHVVLFGLGGLPCALFLAAVNRAVTGAWWRLAWTYYDASEMPGFSAYGHTIVLGIKTMVRLLGEGVLYTCVAGAVLVLLAWGRDFPRRRLTWVLLLAPIIGYVFWWSHGGNRYGPRFYFEGLLPFAVLAGTGLERVLAWQRARAVLVIALVAWVAIAGALFTQAHRQVHARRDVYRAVDDAGIENAVVLLETASSDMVRNDLTRNPPDYPRAPVLYALSRGDLDREVRQAHAGRAFYTYRWTPEGGVLARAGDR